jgi:subtilisin family serine protease
MCKRSVLESKFLKPGLFTTILLVITQVVTALPGVTSPRFIYSEKKPTGQELQPYLEYYKDLKPGIKELFAAGHLQADFLNQKGKVSKVAGGIFVEEKGLSSAPFDSAQETLARLHRNQKSVIVTEQLKQIKTLKQRNSALQKHPIQWNFVMSEVEILKNHYNLKGKNRTLGVISLAYPYGHQALQGRISSYKLFNQVREVSNNKRGLKDLHLVHPLGIAAGKELSMYEGIAPECNIILAQIPFEASKVSTLLEAIEWMLKLETPPDAILFCTDFYDKPAPLPVIRALNACRNVGIIPIVPAGNNPNKIDGIAALPACVTVGSINRWREISLFSGNGPVKYEGQEILKPDCVMPGEAVLGPTDHIEYKFGTGTLQAAAHFAGIFLLVKEALPEGTDPELIVNALLTCCEDIDEPGPDPKSGYGLPKPIAAINHILFPPEDEAVQ